MEKILAQLTERRRQARGLPGRVIPAILAFMSNPMNLHLVSDATGETLNSIARATVAQFEHAIPLYHRWSLIRTSFQLHRVLEGIEHEPGPVLSTLVDLALRAEVELQCRRLNLPVVHVLDPVMGMLQEYIGEVAPHRPGRQYVMNADYFKRIDAMHYVLQHDDGQAQRVQSAIQQHRVVCQAGQGLFLLACHLFEFGTHNVCDSHARPGPTPGLT